MYTYRDLALQIIQNLTDDQRRMPVKILCSDGTYHAVSGLRLNSDNEPEIVEES